MESRLAPSNDSERSVFAGVSEDGVSEDGVSEGGDEVGGTVDMVAGRGFEYATGIFGWMRGPLRLT